MYYALCEDYGLRSYQDKPFILANLKSGKNIAVKEPIFTALRYCDGETDCDVDAFPSDSRAIIRNLETIGYVTASASKAPLRPRQQYRVYPNQYAKRAVWSITGRCNLRCRHCYVSAPQARFGEVSFEKAVDIIDQIVEAGITTVNITGGDPFVRADFMDLIRVMQAKGLVIDRISTNGLAITEKWLDEMAALDNKPSFSISFDGVGCHDWLRGLAGAEEKTIEKIKLLRKGGFDVSVESTIHKNSLSSLEKTMALLADIGVGFWKISPAEASGNWKEEESLCLDVTETLTYYLDFARTYLEAGAPISLQMGEFLLFKKGAYQITPLANKTVISEAQALRRLLCGYVRYNIYISADARLFPCMPVAGYQGIDFHFPSLYETTLSEILTDSPYLTMISSRVEDFLQQNPACRDCEHHLHCGGGCRAGALDDAAGYLGVDSWVCAYFKGGYEEKFQAVLDEVKRCR